MGKIARCAHRQIDGVRAIVCLPTYNERENLEPMVRALGERLDIARDRVLVIDDNSPDGTGEIADALAAELAWVDVLHRPAKEGLGPAYIAGLRPARSPPGPSSYSRSTATSPTTPPTCPA